jgi:DNA end-binding protein Ku
MPRSLATLTIAFGLVAIPVRLYAATQRSAVLRFRMMTPEGGAVRQRLEAATAWTADLRAADPHEPERVESLANVAGESMPADWPANETRETANDEASAPDGAAPGLGVSQEVTRSTVLKGLEIEPGRFVLFTPEELQDLATPKRDTIDLVSFVPPHAVDPVYVEKSYYLGPAQRGERAYSLLVRVLQDAGRCALARWAWRGREHPALLRPSDGALVLHQLHAGDAVRPIAALGVNLEEVTKAELQLALRLIEEASAETFEPMDFIDPARQRILQAARRKLEGGKGSTPAKEASFRGRAQRSSTWWRPCEQAWRSRKRKRDVLRDESAPRLRPDPPLAEEVASLRQGPSPQPVRPGREVRSQRQDVPGSSPVGGHPPARSAAVPGSIQR